MKTKQLFFCYAVFNPKTGKFMNDERNARKRWTKTPELFFHTKKDCEQYWDVGEIPKNCKIVTVSFIWEY